MTLRPGITPRREKGQLEGYAVTGQTGKPGAAEWDLVFSEERTASPATAMAGQTPPPARPNMLIYPARVNGLPSNQRVGRCEPIGNKLAKLNDCRLL
jgi:hypothetical protein